MSDTSLTKLYELHVPVCTIVFGVPAIGHDGEPIQQTVKYNGRDNQDYRPRQRDGRTRSPGVDTGRVSEGT